MAQIAGSRSEFVTSDVGLTDIEYKRKGGCFLTYKKTAILIVAFVVAVVAAGLIGSYVSLWRTVPAIVTSRLIQEDQMDGPVTLRKFSSSASILPLEYGIELTPVLEGDVVKKLGGRVVIHFTYKGSEPLRQLALNAKDITVSKTGLFFLDDNAPGHVHSRRKREDTAQGTPDEKSSPDTTNSDSTVTDHPVVTVNDAVTTNSSSDDITLDVTSMDVSNDTALELSNGNVSTNDVLSLTSTPAGLITLESSLRSDKGGSDSTASNDNRDVVQKTAPAVSSLPIIPEMRKHGKEIPIANKEMDTVDGFYVIYPETPIQRGDYSVEITYEAKVDGLNTFSHVYEIEGQTRWLLASTLKPLGPRHLFPGFDDLDSKAKFSVSITRPATLIALANMPIHSSDFVSDGWVMDHFGGSPALSSHSLAFMIGDFQPIRELSVGEPKASFVLWDTSNTLNETSFIAEKLSVVAHTWQEFVSRPYPLGKFDVVSLPGLLVDGMGSAGLISIREQLFHVTDKSSAITKELVVKNLLKLIGEQWLGGSVSAKSWSDAWILEGSLIYLEHLLAEKIDPKMDLSNSFGVIQHDALERDAYEVSRPLDFKVTSATFETSNPQNAYKKGACLIRMLHSVISDSGFRNGYNHFISQWAYASPGVLDFWNSMSNEANWLPDGVSLTQVMTSWTSQGGFPIVTITRNYETGSAVIHQEQFAHDNSTLTKPQRWYIPLSYVEDGGDFSSPKKSWLIQDMKNVTLNDPEKSGGKKWVLFNVNQAGYYRVNYDLDNWNLLSSALDSTFEKFPVTTRTSLVDDALSLAWGGRLGYPVALNLIRYLEAKETHHSPWTVAFENMVKLNNMLENTAAYPSFQKFMIKFISSVFEKATSSREESQLKLMAVRWACLVDSPKCHSYFKNLSSVPEYFTETYECVLTNYGGKSQWDSLLSKIFTTKDRATKLNLLAALPCSQLERMLESLLTDLLNGEKFDEPETLVLLQAFGKNQIAARSVFQFSRRHWKDVFKRFSKSYPISKAFLVASMSGIKHERDLKDFQNFKEEYWDELKFMGHTIAVGEAEARSKIFWLKTNLLPIQTWLNDYARRTS